MRHAVIIMAHGCWNMLYNIVCHFSRECDVFIHIDARSDVSDDVLLRISSLPQVKDYTENTRFIGEDSVF